MEFALLKDIISGIIDWITMNVKLIGPLATLALMNELTVRSSRFRALPADQQMMTCQMLSVCVVLVLPFRGLFKAGSRRAAIVHLLVP